MVDTPHSRDRRRPRAPGNPGYVQGEETRRRIVESALELFGDLGYAGATTRKIAARAGVNLPALQYYFGGKEGLYLACADHIAHSLEARLGGILGRIESTLNAGTASRDDLSAHLRNAVEALADRLVDPPPSDAWILFMIREQARPTAAFDIVFERVLARIFAVCQRLVGDIRGQSAQSDAVRLRTIAIMSQAVFFVRAREAALRLLDWPDFKGERLAMVKDVLWSHTEAALRTADSQIGVAANAFGAGQSPSP